MARLALVLLLLYNLLFFWNRHLPEILPGMIEPIAGFMGEFKGVLTVLELLGVVAVFVDLIVRFDKIQKGALRNLHILLVAIVTVAFLFKLFINYLDSAYLEGRYHPHDTRSHPAAGVADGTVPGNPGNASSQRG